MPLLSVGMNCALGPKELRPLIEELSGIAPIYVSAYPNAGLPNPLLPTGFPETPETLAPQLARMGAERLAEHRGRLLRHHAGAHQGDCRSGAKACRRAKSPTIEPYLRLSGLDALTLRPDTNFLNIGERTNVTGSPKFAKLIKAGDYEAALAIARQQVENGAQIIDVCMDEGMLDGVAAMTRFLNLIASEPDICKVPVMVDSSKWEVIEAGLKCLQGKGIVNSISLKEGEEKFLHQAQLVRRYGAAVVVMAFDERGQADTFERQDRSLQARLRFARRKGRLPAAGHHFRSERPDRRHRHGGAQQLRRGFHPRDAAGSRKTCRTPRSAAASATFRFRSAATTPCARRCTARFFITPSRPDWTWASSTPGMLAVYEEIPKDLLELVEDVLLNRRPDATERLIKFAESVKQKGKAEVVEDEWRKGTVEERLSTRWSKASWISLTRTPRKRGRNTASRCWSSKAR